MISPPFPQMLNESTYKKRGYFMEKELLIQNCMSHVNFMRESEEKGSSQK